jgi:hypothetical protein
MTPTFFETMPPEELQHRTDDLCTRIAATHKLMVPTCTFTLKTVAGRSAVAGTVSGIHTNSAIIVNLRVVEIPFEGNLFMILLGETEPSHPETGPIIDAIVDSIVVGD